MLLSFSQTQLTKHLGLITQLTRRDIESRHKSSVLGILWLAGQPLIQLLLYSFVFQVVLRSRWGASLADGTEIPFGLMLFVGIIFHAILTETLVRAPSLITSNASYVKRVIFPLEILPIITVASSLVVATFAFLIITATTLWLIGALPLKALLLPIPIFLLALLTLGLGWLFSALGVFFRDLDQLSASISTILLFTAPICYPVDMVPAQFRWLLSINPLTVPVTTARQLLFAHGAVEWKVLGIYALVAITVALIGRFIFKRMRAGFADAI